METSLSVLLVAALATWEAVEIWRHGSIFSGLRARAEVMEGKFWEVLGCGFCLAPWVAFLFVGVLSVETPAKPAPMEMFTGLCFAFSVFAMGVSSVFMLWAIVRDGVSLFTVVRLLVCLGLQVPVVAMLVTYFTSADVQASAWVVAVGSKVFVIGLAAARIANVGNDLTHSKSRTPPRDPEI